MVRLDDARWRQLRGGYRTPYDPRPALAKLEAGGDTEEAWRELWNELHHQGDVGEASYASVPHLVRIHCQRGVTDWNTYAMVAIIELARGEKVDLAHGKRRNPELPAWLENGYFEAIRELAETGIKELQSTKDIYLLRGILCLIALDKGARTYARFLLSYSEEEILDMESDASEMNSLRSKDHLQRALDAVRKK